MQLSSALINAVRQCGSYVRPLIVAEVSMIAVECSVILQKAVFYLVSPPHWFHKDRIIKYFEVSRVFGTMEVTSDN